MPRAKPVRRLQSIVVRCANAIFLKDVAGIRELSSELTVRVDIGHDVQFPPLAAHITDLHDRGVAETLFHLQAVVEKVGRAEVLVYRVRREYAATAVRICRHIERSARRYVREDGRASGLHSLPVISRQRIVRHGVRPDWVILQTIGRVRWWPKIQERVNVDLIVEDAEAPANDRVSLGLVSETQPRSKIVAVWREDGVDTRPLDDQTFARSEYGQILVPTVQRAKVFVAHSVIDAQLLRPLPGILEVKVEGVYV